LPAPSIWAEGSALVRMPPPSVCIWTCDTSTLAFQEVPPPVEVKERIALPLVTNGTITVPSGPTSGCPPSPSGVSAGLYGADQVFPPSVEVLITTWSPLLVMSHSE